MSSSGRLYRVSFVNQGQVYEIYARSISHASLMGFVEVEQLVFGERSGLVVDPSEERLRSEFEGVERSYIPVHAVIRIDQVERRGAARIRELSGERGKVTPFPGFGGEPRK
jgi:Uncharacterized protein conserved in bacteria